MNNHHISYSFLQSFSLYFRSELHRSTSRLCIRLWITTTSLILFSNHFLYTSVGELHRSTSRLCIRLWITTTSLILFSNHFLYTSGCELHRSTSRLCIRLWITTTSLIISPIIFSILQDVSYIEVQVDCV